MGGHARVRAAGKKQSRPRCQSSPNPQAGSLPSLTPDPTSTEALTVVWRSACCCSGMATLVGVKGRMGGGCMVCMVCTGVHAVHEMRKTAPGLPKRVRCTYPSPMGLKGCCRAMVQALGGVKGRVWVQLG